MALLGPDETEDQAIKLFGRVIAPSLQNKRVLSHYQEVLGSHSEEHERSLGGMDDSIVPSSMGTNVVRDDEEGDRKFLLNANNNNNNNNDKQVLESSYKFDTEVVQCPRCNSRETKFCYFNNYNPKQPRHFCRVCQRYWTAGGNLRNVPIGAGRRKSKRPQTQSNSNKHPYPPSPPMNDNNTLLIRGDSTDYTTTADHNTKERIQDREEESGGSAVPLEASSFIERGNIPLLESLSNGGFHAGLLPLAPPPMMPWPFPGAVWNPYQLGGAIFPWMMMPWMAGANMLPPPPSFFLPPGPNNLEEGSVPLPPPKTLRIGDPDAVLKSDFSGFFSASHPHPQFFQKNLPPTTALFPETPSKQGYSNPVAFSRSVAFQESN